MKLNILQNHKEFIITLVIFIITIIFCLFLAVTWNTPPNDPILKEETTVTVNLPIIDWNKYSTLSKQYDNDILKERIDNSNNL